MGLLKPEILIYKKNFRELFLQQYIKLAFLRSTERIPDIDSTSLIISTSSWILARCIKNEENKQKRSSSEENSFNELSSSSNIASEHSSDYVSTLLSEIGITEPSKVAEFVVPRMLKAIDHLSKRDIDNDGLLEQSHNEDWMDTTLRADKIVYSQARWLLALNSLSILLTKLGRRERLIS
jgi:hypothetical protein